MDEIKSIYFELLRICASLYVFLYHMGSEKLGGIAYFTPDSFSKTLGLKYLSAHYFVMIFFVLPGYLISMSVDRPNITFKTFIIARLGRLYSVLLPALIFSYLVSYLLIYSNLIPSEAINNYDKLLIRFAINGLFLTQAWTLCMTPPLNNPFWSVSYEFIYYLLISLVMLLKNGLWKYCFIVLVLLVVGPKVLILLPTWLAGSLLYFYGKNNQLNYTASLIVFPVSLSILIAIIINPDLLPFSKEESDNELFGMNLFFSWNYQADYIFSLITAINIYSLFGISSKIIKKGNSSLIKTFHLSIRKLGNCTYTLYLFHLPLLFLFTFILPYDKENTFHQAGLIAIVLMAVYLIARQTEWKVLWWRRATEKSLNFFISRFF